MATQTRERETKILYLESLNLDVFQKRPNFHWYFKNVIIRLENEWKTEKYTY